MRQSDLQTETQNVPLDAAMQKRLGYVLRRASVAMMADLAEALSPLDLRPVEATILILIGDRPGCTQSEIGRALCIQRANMAPLTNRLVKRGLIAKSPTDGRSHALSLSHTGKALSDAASTAMDAHERQFIMQLTKQEALLLPKGLLKLF